MNTRASDKGIKLENSFLVEKNTAIHAIHLAVSALHVDFLLGEVRSRSGGTSRFVLHARLKNSEAYRSAFTLKEQRDCILSDLLFPCHNNFSVRAT